MNKSGLEIERKFLISKPDVENLRQKYNLSKTTITQIYLKSKDRTERRIRKRGNKGNFKCYYTEKKDVSNGVREESEHSITLSEYNKLLSEIDPNKNAIRKDRYVFDYNGKTIEIDVYPFWVDKAILEVELSSIDEELNIPSEIRVIKEVTDDKRYKNSSLADNTDI